MFEIAVVDADTDEVLEPGQTGELTVRPRHPWLMMQGYLGMPQETVDAWRNFRFHTKDAGYIDKDGYVYIVERLGDRIRRKGENISPYDIESAATAFGAVAEAATIGVPAGEGEDEVMLCITTKDGNPPRWEALFTHLVSSLPHHMVPVYYGHLETFPRTPTNKVQKAVLREIGAGAATWNYKAAGLSIRAKREIE